MKNSKLVNFAGIGIGVALASGCVSRGTASFPGGTAEPDLSMPGGENPMPMAVSPAQPGNVVYPTPQPEKKPEYWQQVNDPYADLSQGRPYIGQGFVIAPPAGSRPSGSSVYVVKKGDTFGKIAQNSKTTVKALKAANPGIDYNKIKVGQKINIPAASASGSKASAAAASQAGVHVVKSGEILGRIANQYGVKVADLKAANGLTSDKITVGQKLKIPGKAAAAPAKASAPAKVAADGTIEVAPPSAVALPPDVPETVAPSLEIAPPSLEPIAPQAAGAAADAAATTVYLANGRQDLYNIAVEKTISIGEIERLNPSLAGNRSRILPAGTPVVLPAK